MEDETVNIRGELVGILQILYYDLRPKPSLVIYDTYYDTRKKSLRRRKISLRTRRLRGTLLISTKSDVRRISGNVIRRSETELPWSYDSVRLLARTLELKTPSTSLSRFQSIPPSRTLKALGLQTIQERRTRREARDVVGQSENPPSTLAELAIDRVTYSFQEVKEGFSEVEVEEKSPRGWKEVQAIAITFAQKYQPLLK